MIRRLVTPRKNALPAPSPFLDRDDNGVPFTVERAFAYCEEIARGHQENFPVASRFLPEPLRRHVWAIYAFARSADDFADEPRWDGQRAEALAYWEAQLEQAFFGTATHPVFVALHDTIERFDLPMPLLAELLTAFRMDLNFKSYATFSQLENYLRHAAHPVGRLMMHVFGYRAPQFHGYSDALCSALALCNFLQDVGVDYADGRVYLPKDDLRHFGVDEAMLGLPRATLEVRQLIRFQVSRTRALLERARPIIDRVGPEVGFEISLLWHAGAAVLDRIEAIDFDVLHRRPTLSSADKARMVAKAASERWPRVGRYLDAGL